MVRKGSSRWKRVSLERLNASSNEAEQHAADALFKSCLSTTTTIKTLILNINTLTPHSTSKQQPQHSRTMSALRGLKRSWSGSARDLGNDDDFEEDDFTITSSNSNSKGSKPPGSSPDTAIELDETTNSPDKSAAKRRAVEADAKEVKLRE